MLELPSRPQGRKVDLVEAFKLRCWARAHLWREGEFDFHEALDVLNRDASVPGGLVETIGQDTVQSIMAAAFRPVREREWQAAYATATDGDSSSDEQPRRGMLAATIEALMYTLRRGLSCCADPANLHRLRCCDAGAVEQIARRLQSWGAKGVAWLPAYSEDDIVKLIHIWRALKSAEVA